MRPVVGSAAISPGVISSIHDWEQLVAGEKYLLRRDVIYKRDVPFDIETLMGERYYEKVERALEDTGIGMRR